MTPSETIFALASAPGRAGVAVFRLSGPGAFAAAERVTGRALPPPRQAGLRSFAGADGACLDRGLVIAMPGPASFTGEDVAELHVHGGAAIALALTGALQDAGLRLAEPGEFTRRAFENGRMDLTEAEGLADLIDAETEAQRVQALRQMDGALSGAAARWREALLSALVHLEAGVDFPDEDDVPAAIEAGATAPLRALLAELDEALIGAKTSTRVREGFFIAVIGSPNAGKSSIINRLSGREAAIVSPIAGTTRDVIEVRLDLGGRLVCVADTAGLRDTGDAVEIEGVRRARVTAERADLRLLVQDGAAAGEAAVVEALQPGDLVVWNKADIADVSGREGLKVSAKTGEGFGALEAALALAADGRPSEAPALSRTRHVEAVRVAKIGIERALSSMEKGAEIAAEDVRLASRALERLTGRVDVEDILDRIFAGFCIGK